MLTCLRFLYFLGEGLDSVDAMAFDQLKLDDIVWNDDDIIGDGSFGVVYYITFKKETFRGHKCHLS